MPQNRPQLGAVIMIAVAAAWVGLLVTPAFAAKALVEVTGQTTSYADGDDGDIQAGVPFPTRRFTDKRNGTVKDNLTGLIWLKNANCFGTRSWPEALTDANTLANGRCGLTDRSVAGDWRLPNVKELQSLIDFAFVNPALSNGVGTAKWAEGDAFSGVQSTDYWSSTTLAGSPTARGASTWATASPATAARTSPTLCGRSGGADRFFDALRLWTLWGVRGDTPLPRHVF